MQLTTNNMTVTKITVRYLSSLGDYLNQNGLQFQSDENENITIYFGKPMTAEEIFCFAVNFMIWREKIN